MVGLLMFLAANAAGAQSSDAQRCTDAEQLPRRNLAQRIEFVDAIRYCEDAGPRLLVSEWRRGGEDRDFLQSLVEASMTVSDSSLIATVIEIAMNRSESRLLRMAAIGTLGNALNAHVRTEIRNDFSQPGGVYLHIGGMSHGSRLGADNAARRIWLPSVRAAVLEIAQHDPDRGIRLSAVMVAPLGHSDPVERR